MEEKAAWKVPLLLECGHTVSIDESELDWNGKYFCGTCGHDSLIDLRRRPIKRLGERKSRTVIDVLRSLIG